MKMMGSDFSYLYVCVPKIKYSSISERDMQIYVNLLSHVTGSQHQDFDC